MVFRLASVGWLGKIVGMERRSRGMLALLGLHAMNEYYRLPWKPPVTAALLAANTLVYLRPAFLRPLIPSIHRVWFNPYLILKYGDLRRFFLSPFYHVGDTHLVYNMMSLLWKGIRLETSMGSAEFASMVFSLLVMSQGISLLLAKSLLLFDYDRPFRSEYAVGFSGVLFAMKVVLNSHSEEYTYVHGLVLPAKYAAWAELLLIQMIIPDASFIGHLSGILAGILYLKFKGIFGSNPFTPIVRGLTSILSWPFKFLRDLSRPRRSSITGRGTIGGNQIGREMQGVWRCRACTYDNFGRSSMCEMCGTPRLYNGSSTQFPHNSDEIRLEEIRRRRIERFSR